VLADFGTGDLKDSVPNKPRGEDDDQHYLQKVTHSHVVLCFEILSGVDNPLFAFLTLFMYKEVVVCISFAAVANLQNCSSDGPDHTAEGPDQPNGIQQLFTEGEEQGRNGNDLHHGNALHVTLEDTSLLLNAEDYNECDLKVHLQSKLAKHDEKKHGSHSIGQASGIPLGIATPSPEGRVPGHIL